jgi:hypothetical protein
MSYLTSMSYVVRIAFRGFANVMIRRLWVLGNAQAFTVGHHYGRAIMRNVAASRAGSWRFYITLRFKSLDLPLRPNSCCC